MPITACCELGEVICSGIESTQVEIAIVIAIPAPVDVEVVCAEYPSITKACPPDSVLEPE
jgi:hypothetical protein